MLFNSKTRKKEEFCPLDENGKVSMYTCGPTVYDYAHVGNFRAFLTYDLVKRILTYFGYNVEHVCNLTDVDDKIIQRANEQNLDDVTELTLHFEKCFMEDLEALNIIKANHYPRATQHVDDMMNMIRTLKEKDLAYETTDGSWYFRTQSQSGYGQQLVQLDYDSMRSDEEDTSSSAKEHFADFCLWKAFKPGVDRDDAAWEASDIAKGRPGWHVECSAMAKHFFGSTTIDLHGGGVDLQFPHHENEIAQSEGANGCVFCNCWFHNGFVNIGQEKMSKSLGNYLTLRGACPKAVDVRAYRYLVVSSQYRQALAFTEEALGAARKAIKRMDRIKEKLDVVLAENNVAAEPLADTSPLVETVVKSRENFDIAIRDDLSMPRAAAAHFAIIKAIEKELQQSGNKGHDLKGLQIASEALVDMDRIFGIFYEVPRIESEEEAAAQAAVVPAKVLELVSQRSAAKEAKDWELADSLRARIAELGFAVRDVKGGEPKVTRLQ